MRGTKVDERNGVGQGHRGDTNIISRPEETDTSEIHARYISRVQRSARVLIDADVTFFLPSSLTSRNLSTKLSLDKERTET